MPAHSKSPRAPLRAGQKRFSPQVEQLERRIVLDAELTVVPGQVFVQLTSDEAVADLADFVAEFDWQQMLTTATLENPAEVFHLVRNEEHQYVVRFFVETTTDVVSLATSLSSLEFLDWAEPNYIWVGLEPLSEPANPNDPFIYTAPEVPRTYYTQSGLLDAWSVTRGAHPEDGPVLIGSFEGVFQALHEDLAANVFINDDEIPNNSFDDDGNGYIDDIHGVQNPHGDDHPLHATQAASVAVARYNNGTGIAGVAGEATVIAAGNLSLVDTIEYLVCNGARSAYHWRAFFSGTDQLHTYGYDFTNAELAALQFAIDHQLLIVGALGNTKDPGTNSHFEGNYGSDLLIVAAGTQPGGAEYFEYGPAVDILAQNTGVPVAEYDNGDIDQESYDIRNGNSWAMPQIAGLAALLWAENPGWSTEQVVARILGTANTTILSGNSDDYLADGHYGAGRYAAGAAVNPNRTIDAPTFDILRFNDRSSTFETTLDDPLEQIWLFSRQLFAIDAFKDAANWELRYAGADELWETSDDEVIPIAPMATYSIGSRWASIDAKGEMPNGLYRFTAKSSGLQDPFGTPLDGDTLVSGADDFVHEFTYSGHWQQPESPSATVLSNSKAPMSVALYIELDETFEKNRIFDRRNLVYVPHSWTVNVDWGDGQTTTVSIEPNQLGDPLQSKITLPAHVYANVGTYTIRADVVGVEAFSPSTVEIEVVIDASGHMATIEHPNGVKDLILWGSENDDRIDLHGDATSLSVEIEDLETPETFVDTTVTGVTGRIAIFAYAGNDVITAANVDGIAIEAHGGHGDDEIWTGSGNDTLGGDVATDSILSELGNDTLSGGSGDDLFIEFGGIDQYVEENARNVLVGGEGDDRFALAYGFNFAIGEEGNDEFEIGSGRSLTVGGTGADTFNEQGVGEHLIITGTVGHMSPTGYGDAILAWFETGSGHSFAERIATLSATFDGGQFIADLSVFEDGDEDIVVNTKVNLPPPINLIGLSWYFLGFAHDKYLSNNAPFAGEVFSNISPVVVTAEYSNTPNEHIDFTLSAGEAVRYLYDGNGAITSSVALAAEFSYIFEVDLDDDGVIDTTLPGGNNVALSHGYTSDSRFVLRIDAASYATPVDPTYLLYIIGTQGNDTITSLFVDGTTYEGIFQQPSFATTRDLDQIVVLALDGEDEIIFFDTAPDMKVDVHAGDGDDEITVAFTPGGGQFYLDGGLGDDVVFFGDGYSARITMIGGAGNDDLLIIGGSDYEVEIHGGDGNDILFNASDGSYTITAYGGAGDDILVGGHPGDWLDGGDGNDLLIGGILSTDGGDVLIGGNGNDVLIGGSGQDSLDGGSGEDILIGGYLSEAMLGDEEDEEETAGVLLVWLEWLQTGDFATRIDYILGTISGPGHISEEFWLVPGETVLDDDVIDTLFGGADADWFLYDPEEDNVLDFDSQEDYATDIDP